MKLFKSAVLAFCVAVSFPTAASEQNFKAWCDAFTAQELISLAANRIYGRPFGLSEAEYKARSEWINDAYAKIALRFKKQTGETLQGYEFKQSSNWIARCQLKDQII